MQTGVGNFNRWNCRLNKFHEIEEVLFRFKLTSLFLLMINHRFHCECMLAWMKTGSWNTKMWMRINGNCLSSMFLKSNKNRRKVEKILLCRSDD